jgi:basic amino acid/polyamine antiporter, APA family
MAEAPEPKLVRAIGRWSLAALTVNCIIGSGVFGLPSVIYAEAGRASPFAWLFAAAATGLVMACFAEVSSRFEQSGGIYLYSRTAFGRTTGISVAWLGWLGRLTASAANANLFIIYLAEFWPGAKAALPRFILLTLLLALLTAVNYAGVRRGAAQSNLFTLAKLLTLFVFIAAGVAYLAIGHHQLVLAMPHGPASQWFHSVLLLMFAYGGFETALMPAAEAKNPRRDYPFALLLALVTCTIIYTATQVTVNSTLANPAATDRPMATAAHIIVGGWGATLVSLGVLFSTYGYLSANILGAPRILFAMSEHGDLPSAMARVHSRYRTPHIAIVVFAVLLWGFAIAGSFEWNVFISVVSRLFYYGSACAALPVLRRRRDVAGAQFHLPAGNVIALLAMGASLLLFPKLDRLGTIVLGVLALCIGANTWWAMRHHDELRTLTAK